MPAKANANLEYIPFGSELNGGPIADYFWGDSCPPTTCLVLYRNTFYLG